MFLRKKSQSTAEYAIAIGLVIAVAAGVLQVALKGGIRQKNQQALNFMLDAGKGTDPNFDSAPETSVSLYNQDYSQTQVLGGDAYVDEAVMKKGGLEEKHQKQTTESTSVSIETIDSN